MYALTRRELLPGAVAGAVLVASITKAPVLAMESPEMDEITSFKIAIPDADLADLKSRLAAPTRRTAASPAPPSAGLPSGGRPSIGARSKTPSTVTTK
jgi:hypothetical protein